MKTHLTYALLLIGAPLFFVKGVKAQNSQPLPEFTKVVVDGNTNIEYIIADRYSAYSETNQDKFKVVNGTLTINPTPGSIKLYAPVLNSIKLAGKVVFSTKDTLKVPELTIMMDDASKATIMVVSNEVTVMMDGAANLSLSGSAQTATVKIDGVAKLKALGFTTQNASVSADGVSNVKLHVEDTLVVKADGSAVVHYAGKATNKNISVDGIAAVKSVTGEEFTQDMEFNIENDDTTKVKIGNKKVMIVGDKNAKKQTKNEGTARGMKTVYRGLEFGMHSMVTPDLNTQFSTNYTALNNQLGKSFFMGLNLIERNIAFAHNKWAITTGLGFTWNGYRFKGNDYLTPNNDSLLFTTSAKALTINKLYVFDVNAPLLVKYAPGKNGKQGKGFHMAAGALLRYNITTQVTAESSEGGYKQRFEIEDDFNINPFKVDATVRLGYNDFNVFVNYALTPYFNAKNGTDVRTVALGVTLIGF